LRQYDPQHGVSVATLAYEYPSAYRVPEHAHGSDQLIYATGGLMEVFSGQNVWLIPPYFALWVPARIQHRIFMPGPVSMRTLYMRPNLTARSESDCAVLHVTALLRELIIEAVRVGALRLRNRYECALRDMLIRQLQKASPLPTSVTLPRDTRALAVAQAIMKNPAESKPMTAMCAVEGTSVRTIQRIFREEVGTSFELWRRQVRLAKAVELLISGRSIKETAFRIGYSQSSAFVEIFRQTFGKSPKMWISDLASSAK
jgi:AraC-like DNA-binding protein